MTSYNLDAGDIVLVKFPFTSLDTFKKRPSLVLKVVKHSQKIHYAILVMITSKVEGLKLEGDVELTDWKKEGLLHPSILRLSKLVTVEHDLIQKKIGTISKTDKQASVRVFSKLYKEWVE